MIQQTLQQQEQWGSVQLVHDTKTGTYLNYRQLILNPKLKHTKVWSQSAANEFGRLAQVVGQRVKGTNTIFFIRKYQVTKDRVKDVTYASFNKDLKPNKDKKNAQYSQQGATGSITLKTLAHQQQT
jgi:hypothetical protein